MSHDNKSGCRFVIVDAINAPEVISFYQKMVFNLCLPLKNRSSYIQEERRAANQNGNQIDVL